MGMQMVDEVRNQFGASKLGVVLGVVKNLCLERTLPLDRNACSLSHYPPSEKLKEECRLRHCTPKCSEKNRMRERCVLPHCSETCKLLHSSTWPAQCKAHQKVAGAMIYYTSKQLEGAVATCENVVRRGLVGTAERQKILRGVGVVPDGWVPGDELAETGKRESSRSWGRKGAKKKKKNKGKKRTDPIQARCDEIISRN